MTKQAECADELVGAGKTAGELAGAGATDELATLQRYLETCEGLRRALGIEGPAPQLHRFAQGECNVNYWFATPQAALDQLEARGGVRSNRLVLRVNHVSQMHLEKQIAYEFSALDLLEPCGRTPAHAVVRRKPHVRALGRGRGGVPTRPPSGIRNRYDPGGAHSGRHPCGRGADRSPTDSHLPRQPAARHRPGMQADV